MSELGIPCLTCKMTEADCCGVKGCCDGCSHLCGEPGRAYRCEDCRHIYISTSDSGPMPVRCPSCYMRHTGGKSGRKDRPHINIWSRTA